MIEIFKRLVRLFGIGGFSAAPVALPPPVMVEPPKSSKMIWMVQNPHYEPVRRPAPVLTDWFPPEITPVHPGWYETYPASLNPCRQFLKQFCFRWWWDGFVWRAGPYGNAPERQPRWWRGLTEPAL